MECARCRKRLPGVRIPVKSVSPMDEPLLERESELAAIDALIVVHCTIVRPPRPALS